MKKKVIKNDEKKIDIDSILSDIKDVRVSLWVMNNSLDALFGRTAGYHEMRALLFQNEKIIDMNIDHLDRLLADLREAGAKDNPIDEKEETT